MRILMLAHRLPYPPTTGDRVRAYHVAHALAARHQLTLACPLDGRHELTAARTLAGSMRDLEYVALGRWQRTAAALGALATGAPLSVRYFTSGALRARVRRRAAAERFDLTYVSSSSMAQYAPAGVPIIMDFVDVDSEKFARYGREARLPMRLVYRLEAARLRAYERAIAARARMSVFVTDAEAALFRGVAPEAVTAVIPNGVDIEYFRPAQPRRRAVPTIVFTGALDYFPNADGVRHFADAILPLIHAQLPGARFVIVGRRPGRAVTALGRRTGIEIFADVPDVRPYMAEADVAVVPLRIARGIQNKILESMAMGLPVVTLPAAAQGIAARSGSEWFVEESAQAFAARVVELLGDAGQRSRVGRRARRLTESQYAWSHVLSRVEALVSGAAAEANDHRARTSGVSHA